MTPLTAGPPHKFTKEVHFELRNSKVLDHISKMKKPQNFKRRIPINLSTRRIFSLLKLKSSLIRIILVAEDGNVNPGNGVKKMFASMKKVKLSFAIEDRNLLQ